jgi:hypothetical protein
MSCVASGSCTARCYEWWGVPPSADGGALAIVGPAWPQVALVATVLSIAWRRLGASQTWCVALGAHVGGTLVVYLAMWLLWLSDASAVRRVTHAPDYGVSVLVAGELGALIRTRTPRLITPGLALLTVVSVLSLVAGGAIDPAVLASLEHLAGFATGALMIRPLHRLRPSCSPACEPKIRPARAGPPSSSAKPAKHTPPVPRLFRGSSERESGNLRRRLRLS